MEGRVSAVGSAARAIRGCIAVALLAALVASSAGAVSITWEDEFADEAVIASGTQVTASDGVVVTFATTVFSDSDGGTFDLIPQAGNADFVTAESSPLGNHSGLVQLAFDNQNDDPADYVELTLTFSMPVYGLAFTVLDVDSSTGTTWDDGLLFTFNGGTNIRSDPSLYTLPAVPAPTIELDNEPGYTGFEGVNNRTATDTQTTGNLAVDFGATGVTEITLRYFSTDDAQSNPASPRIGVSDLYWVVPEPSSGSSLALGLVLLAAARRRR
jgi:hypothetical protein